MFSPISAPVVTVVFSDAVLLSVLESPAVGTSALSSRDQSPERMIALAHWKYISSSVTTITSFG